jgi:hypothetical protein
MLPVPTLMRLPPAPMMTPTTDVEVLLEPVVRAVAPRL